VALQRKVRSFSSVGTNGLTHCYNLETTEGAGKFGWGKTGTGEDGEAAYDENDPNYVSDEVSPRTSEERS
jgi:hypothetical protein